MNGLPRWSIWRIWILSAMPMRASRHAEKPFTMTLMAAVVVVTMAVPLTAMAAENPLVEISLNGHPIIFRTSFSIIIRVTQKPHWIRFMSTAVSVRTIEA